MDNDEPEEEELDEVPILGRGARVFQEGELFFLGTMKMTSYRFFRFPM